MEKIIKTLKLTITNVATDIFASPVPLGTIRKILSITFAGVATADVVTVGDFTVNVGISANIQLPLIETKKPLFEILGGNNTQISDAAGEVILATVRYTDDITV